MNFCLTERGSKIMARATAKAKAKPKAKAKATKRKSTVTRKTTTARRRATTTKKDVVTFPSTAIKEAPTQSQLARMVSEMTDVSIKDVKLVIDAITNVIGRCIKARAVGILNLFGLMKITTVRKKARPAKPGVNPFTGEKIMLKAKPAHNAVKIRALKKLKEMVN